MIDWLVGFVDVILNFILQKMIYPWILFMKEHRKYVIPPDTTKDRIVRENTFWNLAAMAADIICVILIFCGWDQRIATYAGLMAIAICIFVEHGKIYSQQYKQLADEMNVCLIRGKEYTILRKYTPDLGRVIVALFFMVALVIFALLNIFQNEKDIPNEVYIPVMSAMNLAMMWFRLKYYVMDTFVLKDCIIIKKRKRCRR